MIESKLTFEPVLMQATTIKDNSQFELKLGFLMGTDKDGDPIIAYELKIVNGVVITQGVDIIHGNNITLLKLEEIKND